MGGVCGICIAIKPMVTELCLLRAQDKSDIVAGQEIRDALGNALRRSLRSIDHARRSVATLTVAGGWRPTPGEVREACEQTSIEPPPVLVDPSPDCPKCDGTGWELVMRAGLSGVKLCACRKAAQ